MAGQQINFFPLLDDLKSYQLKYLKGDLFAALSVALLALPQGMAYAFLAGLPAAAGIWSVVFGTIFTASFGRSRFLISGTTNMVAIMIQSGTSEILSTYYRESVGPAREALALDIVLQLTLLIGIFQIVAGLARMGRLTQFVSRSVVLGYSAAAAFAIVVSQIFPFFGISEMDEYHPIYQQVWFFFSHFSSLHFATLILAVGSLTLLIILYRVSEKLPAAALVFILSGIIVAVFKMGSISLLGDIGLFPVDLPHIAFPFFELRILGKLVPLAFAIMLLSILEATSLARTYTTVKEPAYNENQEIYALGVSNMLTSFFGGMPGAGSFSRTALNRASGAKTRLAAVFSGGFVFVCVILFGFFVSKIPLAALSALMLFTAYTMVNFRNLAICFKATRSDALVVMATFGAALVFTLDVALYVGIVLSIVLYLKHAAVPYLIEYTFNNLGKLRPLEETDKRPDPNICIIQAEGELFFGAADLLQNKLRRISENESIKVVILQLFNIRYLDASVCLAFEQLYNYLNSTNCHFILAGVSPEVWEVLEKTGLLDVIGKKNCFMAKEQLPGEPTRAAYAYAKSLMI